MIHALRTNFFIITDHLPHSLRIINTALPSKFISLEASLSPFRLTSTHWVWSGESVSLLEPSVHPESASCGQMSLSSSHDTMRKKLKTKNTPSFWLKKFTNEARWVSSQGKSSWNYYTCRLFDIHLLSELYYNLNFGKVSTIIQSKPSMNNNFQLISILGDFHKFFPWMFGQISFLLYASLLFHSWPSLVLGQ